MRFENCEQQPTLVDEKNETTDYYSAKFNN